MYFKANYIILYAINNRVIIYCTEFIACPRTILYIIMISIIIIKTSQVLRRFASFAL